MAVAEQRAVPSQAELVAGLAAGGGEVRETHISWVLLRGDRAYKLKKELQLPFLDYGTAERRRLMCEEEVRLNRRLAPDLYLGVRSVLAVDGEIGFGPPGHPDALDHVVEMRRFDERATLAARVAAGLAGAETLEAVGARLARFHATAPVAGGCEPTAALHRALAENADTLLALAPDRELRMHAAATARFAEAFFAARRDALETRARAGLVRDGHGDLRAEHVILEHGVEVVDCVEFDPALRRIDVGCDLAFLTMDVEALGDPAAAAGILASYRHAGGDPGDDALVAFFGAYRALVRAKVQLVRARQAPAPTAAVTSARSLVALAERLAWRARLPIMVLFAGLSATGKTSLAAALSSRAGLLHLNSDRVRKQLAHGPARYDADFNRRTYARLGELARAELDRSGGVVVDATFRHAGDREAFGKLPPAVVFVECRAPLSVRLERARRRLSGPGNVSDADEAVVRAQAEDDGIGDEVAAQQHIAVRTDRAVDDVLDDLAAWFDARLCRAAAEAPNP